jgi:hypothetical protein
MLARAVSNFLLSDFLGETTSILVWLGLGLPTISATYMVHEYYSATWYMEARASPGCFSRRFEAEGRGRLLLWSVTGSTTRSFNILVAS